MTGTDDYADWLSMRELDIAAGLPKGAAFRAFKAVLGALEEGRDFVVLDHRTAQALAATLIAQGRLYRNSVNPVLLAPAAAARVRAAMRDTAER
ncbi:MAG: hypothetical protein C0434_07825 [Xanthomonadaceae bacterium]|nr:hypothetical protein [Xanthomonadaceae bacterium]